MPLGLPYADPDQLEVRLGRSDNGTFESILEAASRAVESFTRRQFNRVTIEYEALPRRFRALDWERVAVDDFYTLEDLEVTVDGVAWDVETDIDVRPWDGIVGGQIGWPYSDIFAINRSFPWSRRGLIEVAARWGWESVPAGIHEATLDVAEVISVGTGIAGQSGLIRSQTIGGYSVSYGPSSFEFANSLGVPREFIKALPYRRKRFGIA